MKNIFHEFFNPHCEHCKFEREESRVCQSCEVLKQQIERLIYENNQLLNRILAKPEPEPVKEPVEITRPTSMPWNVRRQILEREDRERARLMKDAPRPIPTEDLEKELDLALAAREKEG